MLNEEEKEEYVNELAWMLLRISSLNQKARIFTRLFRFRTARISAVISHAVSCATSEHTQANTVQLTKVS